MADLIVSGGTVISMDGARRVIPDGAVAVAGDTIAAVGPRAEVEAAHAAPKRIDARGKAILPGLIDGHAHAGHGLVKTMGSGDSAAWSEACRVIYTLASPPEFWRAEAALAGLEQLKFGVTTSVMLLGGGDSIGRVDDPAHGDAHVAGINAIGIRRIIGRGKRHREADLDALGRRQDGGGEGDRVDIGAVAVEMMFGQPEHLHAELVAQLRLGDAVGDHVGVAIGVAAFGEQEIAEAQHPVVSAVAEESLANRRDRATFALAHTRRAHAALAIDNAGRDSVMTTRRILLAGGLAMPAIAARAQDRPVQIYVGFAPGGNIDLAARMAAPFLEKHLGGGTQIIVVNKPGAGGMLMLNEVAAAAPDGRHVALVSFPALVTALYDNTPRYRVDSFAYVGLLTDEPYTVFVGTDTPYRSLRDLVEAARARPEAINIAGAGVGGAPHLALMAIERAAGREVHLGADAGRRPGDAAGAGRARRGVDLHRQPDGARAYPGHASRHRHHGARALGQGAGPADGHRAGRECRGRVRRAASPCRRPRPPRSRSAGRRRSAAPRTTRNSAPWRNATS